MFKFFIILIIGSLTVMFVGLRTIFAHESTTANKHIIHMEDGKFEPQEITVLRGEIVVFENVDQNDHWPASNIHPTHDIYPEFDPKKPIKPGESWQFTFDRPGEWRFHDHLNPTLSGIISVNKNETDPTSTSEKKFSIKNISLKDQIKNLYVTLRTTVLLSYFRIFPQDLEKHYLPNKSLARIVRQKDDTLLVYIIKALGPEKAVKKLFDESGQGTRFNCHEASHVIGRLSYELLGVEALEKNITLCHSGYLHGVVAAFVKEKGTENLTANLTALCEQAKTEFGKLTCYHGSGHGLMAYYDNDLPKAIDSCKEYDSKFKQDNCLVGTFMENIGSRLGDSLSNHPTQWLSETDPQFPCNSIDQTFQVQSACYAIQTGWMEHIAKGELDKVVKDCLSAKKDVIPSCFFGYGQGVASATPKDKPHEILSLCEKVPKRGNYFDQCLMGAQAVIMDFWGPNMTTQGDDFCNALPESNKQTCFRILDDRKRDLTKFSQQSTSANERIVRMEDKENLVGFYEHVRNGIKTYLFGFYFRLFPDDMDRYLSHRSIQTMVGKKERLDWAIRVFGPEKLVSKLLNESKNGTRFNCHTPAHEIGRRSYPVLGTEALQKYISLCHSGYIHGVIEAFLKDTGTTNLPNDLAQACKTAKTKFGEFMCYHSAGHGIMAYVDNNLPEAIATCKKFGSTSQQDRCFAGAFMENVEVATGDSFSSHKTEWTNKDDDPYFPCYTISNETRIKNACFALQSDWMLHLYKSDMDKVLQACLGAEDDMKLSCFFGYGKVAVLSARFDPQKTAALCEKSPKIHDYYDQCFLGAQMIIMDFWGPNITTQGDDFCNALPEENKRTCIEKLHERLKDLGKDRSILSSQKV